MKRFFALATSIAFASILLGVLLGASAVLASSPSWNVNDVSILFPLPSASDFSAVKDSLLKTDSSGLGGVLVPRTDFDALPNITMGYLSPDGVYSRLRVVGLRLDPCFGGPVSGSACRHQVRLVWQILEVKGDQVDRVETMDSAIHTFYDLSSTEFDKFSEALKRLEDASGISTQGLPLGVNPILHQEGLHGVFLKSLEALLATSIGQGNFSRITYMQLSGSGNIWVFGGFDVVNGAIKPLAIPRLGNAVAQTFSNGAFPSTTYFEGGVSPAPAGQDLLTFLITESSTIAPSDEAAVIASTQAAYKIENPKIHNADTVDCVSCHTAQSARTWSVRQYPWLMLDARNYPFIYRAGLTSPAGPDLTNESPNQNFTTILRSFGYFRADIAVSQRVINESAEVATQLNAR
jgi:hypothetical protein